MKCSEKLLSFSFDFSASNPTLLVRSRLLLLIHSFDANLLESGVLPKIILNTLEETYGCGLYKCVHEGNSKVLEEIHCMRNKKCREIKKYISKSVDLSSLTHELIRTEFIDFLDHLARIHLFIIFIALNNRSKFRRRLANLFSQLFTIQQLAWDIDVRLFGAGNACVEHSSDSKKAQKNLVCVQCIYSQRSSILSALITDIVCRLIVEFNLIGLESNLYSAQEIPTAYIYNEYVCRKMLENDAILFNPHVFEPKSKHARLYPLILRTRRKGQFPPENHILYVEIFSQLSIACLWLHRAVQELCITKIKYKHSCGTDSAVYALRYKSIQRMTHPKYLNHEGYVDLIQPVRFSNPSSALETASEVFQKVIGRLTQMIKIAPSYSSVRYSNLLSGAKANLLCTKLLQSIIKTSSEFDWTVEIQTGMVALGKQRHEKRAIACFPFYNLKRKQKKVFS